MSTIALGRCHEYADKQAILAIVEDKDITIINADVCDPWDNHTYNHSFIIESGLVKDYQTMVLGLSKFTGVGWDRDIFFSTYKPCNVKEYTPKQWLGRGAECEDNQHSQLYTPAPTTHFLTPNTQLNINNAILHNLYIL